MDPISAGLVAAIVTPLAQKLTDPENVAKGVHWLWSLAVSFLKAEQDEASSNKPPSPLNSASPSAATVSQASTIPGIKPDIEEWRLPMLVSQVKSAMENIEIYIGNLQHLSRRAALSGGEALADLDVANEIKLQRKYVVEDLDKLAKLMEEVYGVKVEGIDKLVKAT